MEANKKLNKLKKSWAYYIVICLFLVAINIIFSPTSFWSVLVIIGWGLPMILRTINYKYGERDE